MNFKLTMHLQGALLEIATERLDDLAKGYLMARELGANGNLPAGFDPYVPAEHGATDENSVVSGFGSTRSAACDEGVVREASQDPIEPVTPAPERETEKPGKKPRAKKEAQAAVAENVAPAVTEEAQPEPAAADPAPEVVAENVPAKASADKVPREVAQAKLGDLLRDKGTEPVAALLKKFGATRFGLYVADDYAEFCAAIDEAAK